MKFRLVEGLAEENEADKGYKAFPKFIIYNNEEYIRDEEMTGDAWSYVRWDSNNDAHYITVHADGKIEAN